MKIILIGGGETIETIYYLGKHFIGRGHSVTIVNPYPDEAGMLSHRIPEATIIQDDGSVPAVLEEANARRADVLLSLNPYDPDNLVACQVAQTSYGVPRTIALVNDPENESVFRQLGITEVFSATKILGTLIESHTTFENITNLFLAAQGKVNVVEVILRKGAPAAGKSLSELQLPQGSLVGSIIRDGEVVVPGGENRLQVNDHLLVITLAETHRQVIRQLTGDRD
jgi:trk system potassium uptake protein TrkA